MSNALNPQTLSKITVGERERDRETERNRNRYRSSERDIDTESTRESMETSFLLALIDFLEPQAQIYEAHI